jgi:hypothetical protein
MGNLFEGSDESRNDLSQLISTGLLCRLKLGRFEVMLDGFPGTEKILAQAQKRTMPAIVDMRGKYEETIEHIGKYAPVSIPAPRGRS